MYHRDSVLDRGAQALANDPCDHRRGVTAPEKMIAQARCGPRAIAALQRRQTPARDRTGPLEVAVVADPGQRRLDERRLDAPRSELRAQPRGSIAA